MKEILRKIPISVEPEDYAWPNVVYEHSEQSGIYFKTLDKLYARITFDKLDSIKVSRGEYLPFSLKKCDYSCWAFVVEKSKWLKERFQYESKFYVNDYEWGGNVNEMFTDFSHYFFRFHDQFVEVIARGLWIETSSKSLIHKDFQLGHPFPPIDKKYESGQIINDCLYKIRINPLPKEELEKQAFYCPQKIMSFTRHCERPEYTVILYCRNQTITCSMQNYFGTIIHTFDQIPTIEEVIPLIK